MPCVGRVEAGRVEDLDPGEERKRSEDVHPVDLAFAIHRLEHRAQLAQRDDALARLARSGSELDARDGILRVAKVMERRGRRQHPGGRHVRAEQRVDERALAGVELADDRQADRLAPERGERGQIRRHGHVVERARVGVEPREQSGPEGGGGRRVGGCRDPRVEELVTQLPRPGKGARMDDGGDVVELGRVLGVGEGVGELARAFHLCFERGGGSDGTRIRPGEQGQRRLQPRHVAILESRVEERPGSGALARQHRLVERGAGFFAVPLGPGEGRAPARQRGLSARLGDGLDARAHLLVRRHVRQRRAGRFARAGRVEQPRAHQVHVGPPVAEHRRGATAGEGGARVGGFALEGAEPLLRADRVALDETRFGATQGDIRARLSEGGRGRAGEGGRRGGGDVRSARCRCRCRCRGGDGGGRRARGARLLASPGERIGGLRSFEPQLGARAFSGRQVQVGQAEERLLARRVTRLGDRQRAHQGIAHLRGRRQGRLLRAREPHPHIGARADPLGELLQG